MARQSLVQDLKGILNDAAGVFTGAGSKDLDRHLDIAAADLGRVRGRTMMGSLTLVAGQIEYTAPTDVVRLKHHLWGAPERQRRELHDPTFPTHLPSAMLVEGSAGREIHLDPAPTTAQIADLGETFRFYYTAAHTIADADADTTVPETDRHLLLIRAAAQAMLELATRSVNKPVQLGPGIGVPSSNGTPAALHETLLKHFERMAR